MTSFQPSEGLAKSPYAPSSQDLFVLSKFSLLEGTRISYLRNTGNQFTKL